MSRRQRCRKLSAAAARRLAFAAQGFAAQRPNAANAGHFRRLIQRLGLLQLDFVNVLLPAHQMVVWSRLGNYDRDDFHRFVYRSGHCTEQWAHEASIVAADHWPLLAHRRSAFDIGPRNVLRTMRGSKAFLGSVLQQVVDKGALTATDLPSPPAPKRQPGDWQRSMTRCALEYHFGRGSLAVADRLPNYQRVYDLPHRIISQSHHDHQVSDSQAQRELLLKAARALGVATLRDLADYYRMSTPVARPLVQALLDEQRLIEVDVQGWPEPGIVLPGISVPRNIPGASLLSPFDPMVWFRPRAQRMFDFEYRIEIYVPADKRRWGYYVLPFRVGDRIVARVDLKADRPNGKLLVRRAYSEKNVDADDAGRHLSTELTALSQWLGLDAISVHRHNAFSKKLAACL